MPNDAAIRTDYRHRPSPEYFADTPTRVIFQPDVYAHAADVAQALGATRIIDFGCGTAGKLMELAPRYEVVGIDYGPNIEVCRRTHPDGRWVEDDFDVPGPVDIDAAGAVVVCSDVIEHVRDPDVLTAKLRATLEHGVRAVLISTPERELTRGLAHDGPPPNRAHVREWTIRELGAYLRRAGFAHGSAGLSRNNTRENVAHTILCAYVADPADLGRLEDALIDAAKPTGLTEPSQSRVARGRRELARLLAG